MKLSSPDPRKSVCGCLNKATHREHGVLLTHKTTPEIQNVRQAALQNRTSNGDNVVLCAGCRLYNIGSPVSHSISNMLDLLERFLERRAVRQKVVLQPSEDVLQTAADISAAKQDLGYQPEVRFGNFACIMYGQSA